MTSIFTFALWLPLVSYLVVKLCMLLLAVAGGDYFFYERAFQISAIVDACVWVILNLAALACTLARSDTSWLGSTLSFSLSAKLWVATIIAICASGVFLAVKEIHSFSHIVLAVVASMVYFIFAKAGLFTASSSVTNWCVAGCIIVYLSVSAMLFILRPVNKSEIEG